MSPSAGRQRGTVQTVENTLHQRDGDFEAGGRGGGGGRRRVNSSHPVSEVIGLILESGSHSAAAAHGDARLYFFLDVLIRL